MAGIEFTGAFLALWLLEFCLLGASLRDICMLLAEDIDLILFVQFFLSGRFRCPDPGGQVR